MVENTNALTNVRFFSSYLGTKRKYGDIIAPIVKGTSTILYDVFGGSGALSCQLSPFFEKVRYNEKNIYIAAFITSAVIARNSGTFDKFWSSVMEYFIDDKESYMRVRDQFNTGNLEKDKKCYAYFWLTHTCTSALVRWNKNKIPGNPWYFNQAYCGKKVDPNKVKDVLLEAIDAVKNVSFSVQSDDYENVIIEKDALVLADPPYDNTYSGYIPEDWDSKRFVDWVMKTSSSHKMCIFGTTKTDDFSDTTNLKPFFDAGWKVLVLAEKAFNKVSPHGEHHANAQDRATQRDVMLYNF